MNIFDIKIEDISESLFKTNIQKGQNLDYGKLDLKDRHDVNIKMEEANLEPSDDITVYPFKVN